MHHAHYSKSKRPCRLCGADVFVSPRRVEPKWRPEKCQRDDVIGNSLVEAFKALTPVVTTKKKVV